MERPQLRTRHRATRSSSLGWRMACRTLWSSSSRSLSRRADPAPRRPAYRLSPAERPPAAVIHGRGGSARPTVRRMMCHRAYAWACGYRAHAERIAVTSASGRLLTPYLDGASGTRARRCRTVRDCGECGADARAESRAVKRGGRGSAAVVARSGSTAIADDLSVVGCEWAGRPAVRKDTQHPRVALAGSSTGPALRL